MVESRYHQVYAQWKQDPEGFWHEAAAALDWIVAPKTIFDASSGAYGRWYVDGVCNTSQNCLDRHIAAGRGDQPALIYDSPLAGTQRMLTYSELLREVELLGHVLGRLRILASQDQLGGALTDDRLGDLVAVDLLNLRDLLHPEHHAAAVFAQPFGAARDTEPTWWSIGRAVSS